MSEKRSDDNAKTPCCCCWCAVAGNARFYVYVPSDGCITLTHPVHFTLLSVHTVEETAEGKRFIYWKTHDL